jgi:hypothetical protein
MGGAGVRRFSRPVWEGLLLNITPWGWSYSPQAEFFLIASTTVFILLPSCNAYSLPPRHHSVTISPHLARRQCMLPWPPPKSKTSMITPPLSTRVLILYCQASAAPWPPPLFRPLFHLHCWPTSHPELTLSLQATPVPNFPNPNPVFSSTSG